MTSFSTSEDFALQRNINVSESLSYKENLESAYNLKNCIEWIKANNYKRLCLQFPDCMLSDAVTVCENINEATNSKIFLLADTSYSSCCIDEVAASHVAADAIIHFGPACLSLQSGIPVFYVFQPSYLNVDQFLQVLVNSVDIEGPTLVFYETKFHNYFKQLQEALPEGSNICICAVAETAADGYELFCGRAVPKSPVYRNAVFIDSDCMLLTNLTLLLPDLSWSIYDGKQLQTFTMNSSKFLMKRLHLVEKVKDAKALGVLVGTLSIDGCLDAVARIKELCKLSGKKCYTVAVGQPNITKLANFPEIDLFVLISCRENRLLIDSKDFYQPIASIFEVELALAKRPWSKEYSLDFKDVQPNGKHFKDAENGADSGEFDVSLISGKVRPIDIVDPATTSSSKKIIIKDPNAIVESRVAQFLSERTWGGLEQKMGQTPVELAVQGRLGVPMGYQDEGILCRKLKVLCLHGYRQDATKLRQQCGALRKILKNLVDMEFLSAPFSVLGEETSRSWWFTQPESFSSRDDADTCHGFQDSVQAVEKAWHEKGPFDGLFGFSQGACFVSLLSAMSQSELTSLKPHFVMLVSGFKSRSKAHLDTYTTLITIPSLHVVGETDEVIPCDWGEDLASNFLNPIVIRHPGGHFVPGTSNLKAQYLSFFNKMQNMSKTDTT